MAARNLIIDSFSLVITSIQLAPSGCLSDDTTTLVPATGIRLLDHCNSQVAILHQYCLPSVFSRLGRNDCSKLQSCSFYFPAYVGNWLLLLSGWSPNYLAWHFKALHDWTMLFSLAICPLNAFLDDSTFSPLACIPAVGLDVPWDTFPDPFTSFPSCILFCASFFFNWGNICL